MKNETSTGLHVVCKPLTTLTNFSNNARTHSKRQVRQIADSIREFGYPRAMPRVLLTFQHYRDAWTVHFIQGDCRTTIGSRTRYCNFATLDSLRALPDALSARGCLAGRVRPQRSGVGEGERVRQTDG